MTKRARKVFEPKTGEWRAVGLDAEIERHGTGFYLGEVVLLAITVAAVIFAIDHRGDGLSPASDLLVRLGAGLVLVCLGWALARALGQGIAPALLKRLDPATAGTLGFLLRLIAFVAVCFIALRAAGLSTTTLAAGGAFTAVIVGLAAQQTLGNLIAGVVLQSTRAFRAGDRVRFINGAFAGPIEGVVSQPGLLHTILVNGADRMLVPNREILAAAILPLREPAGVELQARFPVETGSPRQVQSALDEELRDKLRYPTHVVLEALEDDEVVLRIQAVPRSSSDGGHLAEEIIEEIIDIIRRRDGTQAIATSSDDGEHPLEAATREGHQTQQSYSMRRLSSHAGDGLL